MIPRMMEDWLVDTIGVLHLAKETGNVALNVLQFYDAFQDTSEELYPGINEAISLSVIYAQQPRRH